MTEPLVSICCITYNHAAYIRECLDGFLMQETSFEFEILINDDASTDGTDGIILEYQKKYPEKLKPIIQMENQFSKGGAGKMNNLFNFPRAKGKYIAMCEGDDYWTDPLKLQKQVEFLEKNSSYSACFTNSFVIGEDGDKTVIEYIDFQGNCTYTIKDLISKGGGLFPTASLVFRNIVNNYPNVIGGFKSGDRALGLFLAQAGNFYFLNELTCVYRSHSNGVFSSIKHNKNARNEIRLDNIELLKKFNIYSDYKYNEEIKSAISLLAKSILLKSNEHSIFSQNFLPLWKELKLRDWLSLFYNKIIQ